MRFYAALTKTKENRSDCRFADDGAVCLYCPRQKVVIWAILFSFFFYIACNIINTFLNIHAIAKRL